MLRLLVLISALYGVVGGTKYCCVPDQWEGVVGLMEGASTSGQPLLVKGGVRIHYDYKNKRLAELINITANGTPVLQKIIITKNAMYTITESTQKCVQSKPPPIANCVPDSARETGSFYFGVGNNILKNRAFEIDLPSMQTTAVVSVTQEDCVPVTEAAYGSQKGVPFIVTLGYVNITPGITDPSVFNVPSFCTQSTDLKVQLNELKTGVFWLDYLHARHGFFQNV